jgi:hypothetical protein
MDITALPYPDIDKRHRHLLPIATKHRRMCRCVS